MMIYRAAIPKDEPRLRELEQRIIEAERPLNPSIKSADTTYYDLGDLISNPRSCVMVAEEAGTIVGTGYAQIRQSKSSLVHVEHAYLGFMYVEPNYRGQGVNKRIMDFLIEWATQRKVHDFYLDVYSQNTSAIKAYEKAGFKPCLMEMKRHVDGQS